MRLPLTKCAMLLTRCWSYKKIWWNYFSQNLQCHSLPVGHRERCDEAAFHKMCNSTHNLLVIKRAVMRLPSHNVQCHSLPAGNEKRSDETVFHKCGMSLTPCCSYAWGKMWWDGLSHNVISLTSCWLSLEKDVIFTKCAMSLTTCWS